jgi:hypothetical protein
MTTEVAVPKNVVQLLRDHVSVPQSEHCQLPKYRMRWLFEHLLPTLGLGKVVCTPVNIDGRDYYRVSIKVPGRSINVTLTPVGAYYLGMGIFQGMASNPNADGAIITNSADDTKMGDLMGTVFVPRWALVETLDNLTYICRKHEDHIKLVVREIHRLMQPQVAEEAGIEDAEEEQPTLH